MAITTPRYIDVVDVARLVRQALKGEFPDVRFSVRSSRYAGGASILVTWKEGPQECEVSAVAHQYEGARTDGDYSPRSVYHYLRPDGQTLVAHNPASYAIGASEPEGEDNRGLAPVMSPDIELVHFGSDFVHCYREPSDEGLAERERQYRQARVNRDPRELPF